jgi:hypothetical protein
MQQPVLERARLGLVGVDRQVALARILFAAGSSTLSLGRKVHLSPVGKPAPPRPRSADFLTSSVTASGFIEMAFLSPSYPPVLTYSSYVTMWRPFGSA